MNAQENPATVRLYTLETSSFPKISGFLDAFDGNGIFMTGMKASDISIIEDGQTIPLDALNEIAVPLQMVIAVNQGPSLDVRDPSTNLSRFQRISQVLDQWLQTRPADLPDDYSLVSQAGPVINHADAKGLVAALNTFQPPFRSAIANLQSLSIALDTVSAETTRRGMKRAILFITPKSDEKNLAANLDTYIQRAAENDIRIFVWFVDATTSFTSTSAAAFNNLALQTKGAIFMYSGVERFPDLETYFSGLRRVYSFDYTSRIKTAGEHQIHANVNTVSGVVSSTDQTVSLDIQPPNPFPLATLMQITRRAPEDDPFNTEVLIPKEQQVEMIVEFPDGYKRPLTRSTLYVDGIIVDENTGEPFNFFTWNLEAYTSSGEHQLTVEVFDTLGLSKSSLPLPVVITVVQPPQGIPAFLAKYRVPLTIGGISLAGLTLLIILLSGRLKSISMKSARAARRADQDPLRQSLPTIAEQTTSSGRKVLKPSKKGLRRQKPLPDKAKIDAPALLIRINIDGQPLAVSPIAIAERDIVFGNDPIQCNQVLSDPSISTIHARLRQTDDGGFLLLDNGSMAGTWVNFDPIPSEGYRLKHGDVVNFGQLIYRFTLKEPPTPEKPTVKILDTES